MDEKKRLILIWIGARLREHSTRQGINALAALIGIALAPEWTDLTALAAGFVASLIAIITNEMKPHVSDRRDTELG